MPTPIRYPVKRYPIVECTIHVPPPDPSTLATYGPVRRRPDDDAGSPPNHAPDSMKPQVEA